MSMRERGNQKAEEWIGVLRDFSDDVYLDAGEEGVEAFWSRLFELFLQEHEKFRADHDALVESKAGRYEQDFLRQLEQRDVVAAVEGFVFAAELPWRQALDAMQRICFRHLVPEELALEAYALLALLRCPPQENPKLQAVRIVKDRGKRKLDDAIREVEELARRYRLPTASEGFAAGA
ncbi:MAG TPA: hypothetical protein VGN57_06730 [Pirellulaceae bacterium]|nr:hypothetical protein [Pirellulaceae bacterium]